MTTGVTGFRILYVSLHANTIHFSVTSNIFMVSNLHLGLLHQMACRVSTWDISRNRNGVENALALKENRIHFLQVAAICFGEEKVDN